MSLFSSRWSTFALLCTGSLAGVLGFCGREFLESGPKRVLEQKTSRRPGASLSPADFRKSFVSGGDPGEHSRQLLTQTATSARDEALISETEKWAEQNPLRSIEAALGQTNRRLRIQLLDAAFRGWGKTDAIGAVEWILAQPAETLDCGSAVASMLKGAVRNPGDATRLTLWLNQQVPAQAREFGDALIYALAQNGDFAAAADFARGGDGAHRTEWLSSAYGSWANYQPQSAAASALALEDADLRSMALSAVISSWGQIDPKNLADFAVNHLPESDQRTHALSDALVFWAAENPGAAATWINRFAPAPDFDSGRAAVATQPDIMKQPDVAIKWAQSIVDQNFRSRTISAVLETWSLANPAGALNFAKTSVDITSEDRTALLSKLGR